jgi:hypothetical protein
MTAMTRPLPPAGWAEVVGMIFPAGTESVEFCPQPEPRTTKASKIEAKIDEFDGFFIVINEFMFISNGGNRATGESFESSHHGTFLTAETNQNWTNCQIAAITTFVADITTMISHL